MCLCGASVAVVWKTRPGAVTPVGVSVCSLVSGPSLSSPFLQASLSAEECYILDNGVDRNVFVWKGETSQN
jgi:hypothetical protein